MTTTCVHGDPATPVVSPWTGETVAVMVTDESHGDTYGTYTCTEA